MVDTLKTIESILAGYYKGNGSIDVLLDMQDKLAVHSYRLAEMSADMKSEYNGSYFMRKITISKKTQAIIRQTKTSKAQAEVEATNTSEDLLLEELNNEAEAFKYDLLLRQVNKVLSAMQQRISYLKIEFDKTV